LPTADFSAAMRRDAASLDLQEELDIEEEENGLERFLTATRRQNFLCPAAAAPRVPAGQVHLIR
jgi:hypothetical protein